MRRRRPAAVLTHLENVLIGWLYFAVRGLGCSHSCICVRLRSVGLVVRGAGWVSGRGAWCLWGFMMVEEHLFVLLFFSEFFLVVLDFDGRIHVDGSVSTGCSSLSDLIHWTTARLQFRVPKEDQNHRNSGPHPLQYRGELALYLFLRWSQVSGLNENLFISQTSFTNPPPPHHLINTTERYELPSGRTAELLLDGCKYVLMGENISCDCLPFFVSREEMNMLS